MGARALDCAKRAARHARPAGDSARYEHRNGAQAHDGAARAPWGQGQRYQQGRHDACDSRRAAHGLGRSISSAGGYASYSAVSCDAATGMLGALLPGVPHGSMLGRRRAPPAQFYAGSRGLAPGWRRRQGRRRAPFQGWAAGGSLWTRCTT